MAITIKDVAKLAGVSPSTVSRVISKNQKISLETTKKVEQAMETLGYHPNLMAKSLVSRSTKTIGLILPLSAEEVFLNPFFSEVLRGINAYLNYVGFDLLMSAGSTETEEKEAFNRLVFGGKVDGVILLTSREKEPLTPLLMERNFPFVIIGRPKEEKDIFYVDNDNVKASYDATVHLIEQGHKRIGFVSGPRDLLVSRDREDGYKKALQEYGIESRPDWITEAKFLQESGYNAISFMLSLPERPTAIIVTDDIIGLGVLKGLYELGCKVPEEISIVGFNNISMSELATPPLTTIDIGIYQLGYTAAQLLIRQIKQEESVSRSVIVPHRLVVRKSTTSRLLDI